MLWTLNYSLKLYHSLFFLSHHIKCSVDTVIVTEMEDSCTHVCHFCRLDNNTKLQIMLDVFSRDDEEFIKVSVPCLQFILHFSPLLLTDYMDELKETVSFMTV